MGAFLNPSDLEPFATIEPTKAEAMIEDAEAMAVLAAPCISVAGFTQTPAVKAILRGAVLRWNEAGTGALSQRTQAAGIFSHGETLDTRQERRGMFWPSEIVALQNLCADAQGGVYSTNLGGATVADGYWAQPNLRVPL